MTGLVYKELRQNLKQLLWVLLITAFTAFVAPAWVIHSGFGENVMQSIGAGKYSALWFVFLAEGFLVSGMVQGTVFREDNKKVFAYFIASTPEGINGYLRIKYELTFVMVILTLFSVQLGDWIMGMVCAANSVQWFDFLQAVLMFPYLQIIMRALEIPFTLRFGFKNGSIIKTIAYVVIVIFILIIYALYGEALIDIIISGNTKKFGTALQLLLSLLPVISFVMLYLSYKLSCRLYMKGVEQYDK